MGLSREGILAGIAARRQLVEPIEVPEWGGAVFIRHLSAAELEETGFLDEGSNGAEMPVRILAACLADETGSPLFAQEDAKVLADAEFAVILRVFAEAARINGLSSEELEAATAAFAQAQGDASSTG